MLVSLKPPFRFLRSVRTESIGMYSVFVSKQDAGANIVYPDVIDPIH